ncbi:PEGA domain-containing protein [Polyangium mundeleinium]|uniref:PEGA domain-containing protein n=1 Tax=Polyangium mundeleinium TaxID=2995306 RepID=A0ABT5EG47_9BACT|nr:PEGA domain-containing protein [Polyangium mundeleinium]MDC0740807.1 PEGA domain-containing protein [Polyangium mundeleinium]
MGNPRPPLVALGTAIMAVVQGALPSDALVPSALAQSPRKPDDDGEDDSLLLTAPSIEQPMYLAHRSHSSHRSHASHRSHYSGGYGSGSRGSDSEEAPAPPPPPPKPATVSLVAYPGGRIFVDGKLVGTDSTATLTLTPGRHEVRVENKFVGDTNTSIDVSEGQTGMIVVQW